MRTVIAATLLVALAGLVAAQDDRAKQVAEQKKKAEAGWKSLEVGDPAFSETKHLLIFAPGSMDKQLKATGALLEKYHEQAIKATALDTKEGYPGKITVYLLPDRETLAAFARRVEKRRVVSGETGSYKAADDALHVAAYPLTGKNALPAEARAGELLATVILQRKAGRQAQLPDWLLMGFGRATSYQVSPKAKFVLEDRKLTRVLVKKKDAKAIWESTLEGEEIDPLQGSLAEFLAYGTTQKRFVKFIGGFAPGENTQAKTTPQALEAADTTADRVAKAWKAWVK